MSNIISLPMLSPLFEFDVNVISEIISIGFTFFLNFFKQPVQNMHIWDIKSLATLFLTQNTKII